MIRGRPDWGKIVTFMITTWLSEYLPGIYSLDWVMCTMILAYVLMYEV